MSLIILPIHLYDIKYIDLDITDIIIWEHPHFFTNYNFNKKKLMLHRASMKYYASYLNKYKKVVYVDYDKKFMASPNKLYYMFDPIDIIDFKIFKKDQLKLLSSPNFLLDLDDYAKYRNKTSNFFFNAFYMWGKKLDKINIIPTVKSQDKLNRKKMQISELNSIKQYSIKPNKYVKEAQIYVDKHFPNNYGDTDNFTYPTTHEEARKMLLHFLKYKLNKFGTYQDYISDTDSILYHSFLSSSINIGLIQPSEIIYLLKRLKSKSIDMNNLEGYVRQLFWREYQRYCHIYCDFTGNYFGNNKKLSKKWYDGTLNILPVDNCIKKAFSTGYLHHIERLMIIGNYMNLSGIEPMEGFRWFMEFSCDSYEWVMKQNVLDMVFCVTGGRTMRKVYISSSNYVIKMSNYKKGDWATEWDILYWDFLKSHKKLLWKFRYSIPQITQV